ncbi:MAG TPA: RNA-binding S4 domain-containing protein [Paracoccus sp.]|nr:RNA-binding S4 domain-containing protein [Paracoccus sp. (in: a-proteobacteria)]
MATETRPEAPDPGPIRLDKWLWHARFFKSRSLAAQAVGGGRMRLNSQHVAKPAALLRPGDVLTFVQGERVRVVRMLAPGQRRGPAPEAQALYEDLSPAPPPRDLSRPQAVPGGRPEGRERRALDALRGRDLPG